MLRFAVPGLVVVVLSSLAGCAGSIAVVHEDRAGGTLALRGAESGARERAAEHMKARCPGGYEIVEEGDAATDEGDREWRVAYACKGATGKSAKMVF